MHLPEVSRRTSATVDLLPDVGQDGAARWIAVMKQRFAIGPRGRLDRVGGAVLRRADVPWDPDAPGSSVKYPSDASPGKPGTDVVLVGSAVAPGRVPVRELGVQVRVGPVQRRLRVTGLRVWYRAASGVALTPPEPFSSLPLRWEYAWGGADLSDPAGAVLERRNPVGRGAAVDPSSLIHQPGPQIEDPARPIQRHPGEAIPAGVAAIAPHWEPRLGYAGTMDDAWARERMPLRPRDYDERHQLVAAPGLSSPVPLRGGEPVQLVGVSAAGPLAFALPRVSFGVAAVGRRGRTDHRPVLDTVLVLPDEAAVELTWRVALRAEGHEPRGVLVFEKEPA